MVDYQHFDFNEHATGITAKTSGIKPNLKISKNFCYEENKKLVKVSFFELCN